MKYLLDTNILIWYPEANPVLPKKIKRIIDNNRNEIFVSIASLWEISIKYSINKLELSAPLELFFQNINNEFKFSSLPILE